MLSFFKPGDNLSYQRYLHDMKFSTVLQATGIYAFVSVCSTHTHTF